MQENSLGIHIRHSDKGITRGGGKLSVYHCVYMNIYQTSLKLSSHTPFIHLVIPLSDFFSYVKAFVESGGGSVFVATDSSLVIKTMKSEWPTNILSHVVYQSGTILSHNDTATFELGSSSHHRTNVEALTDILALSKCTYLVHGNSALSESAFYLNPLLIERSINLEHNDQDAEAKYAKILKMIKS